MNLDSSAAVSGFAHGYMDDGTEAVASPGDVFVIESKHDGWVPGDEPCVLLDWPGMEFSRALTRPRV